MENKTEKQYKLRIRKKTTKKKRQAQKKRKKGTKRT